MAGAEQQAEGTGRRNKPKEYAGVAQSAEHLHGKEGVRGSSPLSGSEKPQVKVARSAAAGRLLVTGAG
jgi:hypothetical protein